MFYQRVSDFFEAEGDFEENTEDSESDEAPLPSSVVGLKPWHGCMDHNSNHCQECQSCSCFEES